MIHALPACGMPSATQLARARPCRRPADRPRHRRSRRRSRRTLGAHFAGSLSRRFSSSSTCASGACARTVRTQMRACASSQRGRCGTAGHCGRCQFRGIPKVIMISASSSTPLSSTMPRIRQSRQPERRDNREPERLRRDRPDRSIASICEEMPVWRAWSCLQHCVGRVAIQLFAAARHRIFSGLRRAPLPAA